MKKNKQLNSSVAKDWGNPNLDSKDQYLSDIFMLAGVATTLVLLVSVTI